MRSDLFKSGLKSGLAAAALLWAGGAFAQQTINLTAAPSSVTLPDGNTVPMWGYTCGAAATNAAPAASCSALNPSAAGTWSPVVITVPTGQALTINLSNSLSFANGNTVPTSLTIVGQVGGGLGDPAQRTTTPSPTHATQTQTNWPTVSGASNTPPPQGPRVQSFGTEVAAGATTALTWKALRPGTYLLESGTHPSIQGPMGLYGIVVVTSVPTATSGIETAAGCAYPGSAACAVPYDGEIPVLMSEIDPNQNSQVSAAVNTQGFSETAVWSGQPGGCGNPASSSYQTCYPPTVNYTPLYYMMNGVAFSRASAANSLFTVNPGRLSSSAANYAGGSVLVRVVNAGLRMHVPSIVGSTTTGLAGPGATPNYNFGKTVPGFQIVAEDGRQPNGVPKVQSDVFMAAGKTYDLLINAPAVPSCTPVAPATTCTPPPPPTLPIFDRELSLSANQINRDGGMLAYIGANGAALPAALTSATAQANPDTYSSLVAGQTFSVSDPSKGVIANDVNVYGVQLLTRPSSGTVVLNPNGTFTYTPTGASTTGDSFSYCANGAVTGGTCASGISATVTLGAATIEPAANVTCSSLSFTATTATYLAVKTPGLLTGCVDKAGYPLKVALSSITPSGGLTVNADVNGGFTAVAAAAGPYSFTFQTVNSQGTLSAVQTASLMFLAGSGLTVSVIDGQNQTTGAPITDYRWVIEEDETFYIDPKCTTNPPAAGCPTAASGVVPTLGVNFHTSHMNFVAQGCTGPLSCESGQTVLGKPAVCDVSNGVCRPDMTGQGMTPVMPSAVHLDPTKRYYISVLPGDAANPFNSNNLAAGCSSGTSTTNCGHGMGGAPIAAGQTSVAVLAQPSPYPPGKLSVMVFEDDFPLNGEQDGGGGLDVLAPYEPGLGGFQIHLWDAMGGNGDFTGQMTYDMFNQPLTNSLDGTIDPANCNATTGVCVNACPITKIGLNNPGTNAANGPLGPNGSATNPSTTAGITGMIVTCPKYEADGVTLSPLAGQAVIANLMPGRWGVIATPGADRISRGEEWLQTNTLDGQKAHDVFTRIGEPSYFQEYGPASYHVVIGFANPAIINARHASVCGGNDAALPGIGNCTNSIKGRVVGEHLSRTPDERIYPSGSHDAFAWSQCYVSFGDPDGEDFAFTKCKADGTFEIDGLPPGDWRVTTFDQWNDALVDGLSTPVGLPGKAATGPSYPNGSNCNGGLTTNNAGGQLCNLGDIATTQWETNLYTRTFIDDNKDGVSQASEDGIPFLNVAVRLRDGSLENLLVTDFTGTANFNETFPLFSWYVVETDTTRYKNTGTHAVYDVGGPTDGSPSCGQNAASAGYPNCGQSTIGNFLANTLEQVSVPNNLRIPGAVYCAGADCSGKSIQNGPATSDPSNCSITAVTPMNPTGVTCTTPSLSSGRIDPPWVGVEGWQGFPGQNNFLEFGKEPYAAGENGGIKGHVIYASTRPFDDPQMLVQTQWEPLVPRVTMNLYQEGFGADGVTPTLTLVDSTQTSSWDDWAQGVRADGVTPNMNCPGQSASDLFLFSLLNQPQYLDYYNNQLHGTGAVKPLPGSSQFKCYDGMHNWNQLQPAPYDGMYQFPSVTSTDANGKPGGNYNTKTGLWSGSNCTICKPDPVTNDLYAGIPQLPPGKYVVEVVVPNGYELVKEEDKNILIGDNYIAPVTEQFGALGNIFIIPDQASVAEAGVTPSGIGYNANNAQNPTQSFGATPNDSTVPGFTVEPVWPCVGTARIVPDYISLFPKSQQVAPFAGATRNLCDRKEVTLGDQQGAIAKFYIYTSTHIASKFYGGITDDYTSEFDPFSPQFGEKFAPPNLPVSVKDWAGNETNRVYADQWGQYNGMTYSTWEVNPPNPTGYSPTMMVFCMNDQGTVATPDALFNPAYSQFCYELPFMPGTTQYLDTPVVPTTAFAGSGYNNVDCAYPTLTPAVSSVTSADAPGPWVKAAGDQLIINALGDQQVPNHAYTGPSATGAPYNEKTITRHYGFGATAGSVTIGGFTVPSTAITLWSDTQIKLKVPAGNTSRTSTPNGIPACPVQQLKIYGGPGAPGVGTAYCGELVITAANGQQSIDAVTVTLGGKPPTVLPSTASASPLTPYGTGAIQQAIDVASPGDLIIVPPGLYQEMVLMWKPVRLQGVGAASTTINANTQPAGKLDPWRREVNCLYGLTLQGRPDTGTGSGAFDPTSTYTCGYPTTNASGYATGWAEVQSPNPIPQVDRLPLEGILGWDTTVNGNLAQLLQEPTLMGAYEGAAITVLGKGVAWPAGSADPFGSGSESSYPTGTTLLGTGDCNTTTTVGSVKNLKYPSNFQCNPSSIDGLTLTNSSQGGGGVFVHAWGHQLQIANNRVYGNAGTLTGGITIGQGESPDAYTAGGTPDSDPGSCNNGQGLIPGQQLPYCFNLYVNVHNNYVSLNSSIGDELYSSSPAGGGGATFCTGSDYYKFQYNWVCGNLSSGDGGGFVHLGYTWNGDIEHNSFLFNQSTNPTVPTNGGGLMVMGAPPDGAPAGAAPGTECGSTVSDLDCAPGLSDGVGPGLVINANLIMGNTAESGTGGGLAFQNVNGTEVVAFPLRPALWNNPLVTNNIIADNVAGWDGGGISLEDSLNTTIVNNTIISNSTTASAGILFNALGAPIASQQGTSCTNGTATASCPQIAGLVSVPNSAVLAASLPAIIACPSGHYDASKGLLGLNGSCKTTSYPELYNNVIWQNSAYYIGVGALSAAYQQNVVSLYNAFTTTMAPNQPQADATTPNGSGAIITGGTGACVPGASYWDIGVRGDAGPANHGSGVTLHPVYSVLTDAGDYPGTALLPTNDTAANPTVISQYCDGSRTPPEAGAGGAGWSVPPGISDATVPNPSFNLTPVATVDEGNNWVNLRWGPLSLLNPVTSTATTNVVLANYGLASGSSAIDYIPQSATTAYGLAPSTDFYGNARKTNGTVDAGAVEYVAPSHAILGVTGGPLAFGDVPDGTTSAAQTLTLRNTGGGGATAVTVVVTAPFSRPAGAAGGTCGAALAAAATCTINIVFSPVSPGGPASGTATITASVAVSGSPVTLTGTGVAASFTASVSPSPLAFGNWATGTTSNVMTVTVTNTGNQALAGGTFTFGGGTPQPYSRPAGTAGGTCGPALAVGATCTVGVQFAPTSAVSFSRTLTVSYAGATVTPKPVSLTGNGVAARATVSVTPNPLTITLPTGTSVGTGTVTFTNTASVSGASMTVSNVQVAGGFIINYIFSKGTDGCTGTTLAPGASCTVGVSFMNVVAARGANRAGTITFTDNGAASPQVGNLTGFATP
ncbi:MAG TPA: choice-of-anchor D domain-containing protein [Steroidobacteraceae bacterium]|nr:choice-of-anchor D domain-containing protein [Steroidobacteraceae bacterium]